MANETEIRPALTVEEWAALRGTAECPSEGGDEDNGWRVYDDGSAEVWQGKSLLVRRADGHVDTANFVWWLDLPRTIAVANLLLAATADLLPTDSGAALRILRQEDVRILRYPHRTDSACECSMWWLSDYPGAQTCDCGDEQKLRDLADRIAALLPPN